MAFRAPLLGYNTNVRHKGKLYHIQTEDSGVDHPHVITHLFADGGRIVASRKTSYAERVGSEGLQEIVKKLMQAQHKAMFIALRDGAYDEDAPADDPSEQTGTRQLAPSVPAVPPPLPPEAVKRPADDDDDNMPTSPPPDRTLERERAPLYQGTQPAATTSSKVSPFKPNDVSRSLFGGDLLSDKSLDEVILNYLAANDKEA